MHRALGTLRTLLSKRGTTAFLIASIALGVLVGIGTSVLTVSIEVVERFTSAVGDRLSWGSWLFVIAVPLGMFVAYWLNDRFGPGVSGGGVTRVMIGMSLHGGYLPTRLLFPKVLASAFTLGTGGSGGAEGPIAYIGASLGSTLSRYTNFDHDRIRSLVAAGAGAGIGAVFNAPIAGMLFAMEVILGSFAIRHLNAVVIASVVAAVTTHLMIGEELLLTSPPQRAGEPAELLLFVLLAVVAVGFGLIYLKAIDLGIRRTVPPPFDRWMKPILYGVTVGLIGVAFPESLGTGREFLSGLLTFENAGSYVWWTLALIAFFKIVTSVLTRAGGGSAGTFMPALVVGGTVGASFALVAQSLGASVIDVGAYAVVGMAAVFATVARAPLTSVIIVFELTGNYELILPLMLGAALATFLGDRFHKASAYTLPLKIKGIQLPTNEDIDLLDTVTVQEVMKEVDGVLRPWQSLADAAEFFDTTGHHGAPVVNDEGELKGMLTLSDIAEAGGPHRDIAIADAMSTNPITITPSAAVSEALARMASMGFGRMPVVDELHRKHVIGMFRRESVVSAYEHALSMAKGRELYRERNRIRALPGADFFVVEVKRESDAANSEVASLDWPAGTVLVSVQRSTAVLVPSGNTVLRVGDTVTAFGPPEAHEQLLALTQPRGNSTVE